MNLRKKHVDHLLAKHESGTFGIPQDHSRILEGQKEALRARFLIPPFSVWNTRDREWRNRKRAWLKLGIESELGREIKGGMSRKQGPLLLISKQVKYGLELKDQYKGAESGISVFDPVVCELCYSWWCPPAGQVVDPFAGGSVRGILAGMLGLPYWGCDLNKRQIQANRTQAKNIGVEPHPPKWICGDSRIELEHAPTADFLFSCPPYGNLERYSDDPDDLSTMPYEVFLKSYRKVIRLACRKLKENRFAVFVVGNFRDKKTNIMVDFVGDTVRAFQDSGLQFYNDIILVSPCGSASMRANRIFKNGKRKVVKLHQNVLVFVKGQPDFALNDNVSGNP